MIRATIFINQNLESIESQESEYEKKEEKTLNEGTALYWNDVDLSKERLRVHHMLIIKTRNDWKRIIALDDDTINILREWRSRQSEIGLGNENDFIFSYDGLPMIKSTIGRIISRYAKLANVKKIQAKGLRHSHASYLINEFNVSVLVLSQRMGHSSPEITLKHYAHMWSGAYTAIAELMTGNVEIKTADQSKIRFNGNQSLKK